MGLDYAAEHLLAAVRSVAVSEGQLRTRLQTAWDESVQLVGRSHALRLSFWPGSRHSGTG